LPRFLSEVRGRTSRWLNRVATTSRTTSSGTLCPLIMDGSSCRRRVARTATTTPIQAGKSLRSGAAAVIATWSGAAIAAQPFTHRSRDRIAESATEAPPRCGKTNNAKHQTATAASWLSKSAYAQRGSRLPELEGLVMIWQRAQRLQDSTARNHDANLCRCTRPAHA
jgi:hypothetical protein